MRHRFWKPTSVMWKYYAPSREKVEHVIFFKVKLYRSWTRFSWVWMVFQCFRYIILVSGSSDNILGSTDGLLEDWGLCIRVHFAGLCTLDGPGSGEARFLTSITGLTSGISWRARWRSMLSILLKDWPQTGQVIV
jgi:hypothetical protein